MFGRKNTKGFVKKTELLARVFFLFAAVKIIRANVDSVINLLRIVVRKRGVTRVAILKTRNTQQIL